MRQRNQWIIRLLVVVLVMQLLAGMGEVPFLMRAEAAQTGYCTANYLNVRKGPGTSYAIVTASGSKVFLSKNDQVTILGTSGDWKKIETEFKGVTVQGYCLGSYIKTNSSTATTTPTKVATATPTPTANAGESYAIAATVIANTLNIRSGAGTSYSKVGTVYKNADVTVIGKAYDSSKSLWYQVKTTISGKQVTGYMLSTYVKLSQNIPTVTPTKAPTATPTATKKPTATPTVTKKPTATVTKAPTATPTPSTGGSRTGIVTANSLNLRAGAGTTYTKCATLTKNTALTVLGEQKDSTGALWYCVQVVTGGKTITGYMLAQYIKITGTITPTKAPTATPTVTKKPTASPTSTPTKKPTATPTVTKKPTATPTPAVYRTGVITANELNIRSGAGTTYTKYATLTKDTSVTILKEQKDRNGALWYQVKVSYQGSTLTGYMLAQYIKVTGTVTATPKPTATNTPTPKPTATNTPTPKPTATNTPTPKPTATNTPTPKPTATNTPTPKPTATNTPTPKPTATNTPTPTPTVTEAPVSTVTPSPSESVTPVGTPTITPTPGAPKEVAATVNASSLNMRSGAGTEYSKIVNLTRGQAVTVISYAYDSSGALWYEVTTTIDEVFYRGYMLGQYLELSEDFPLEDNEGNVPDVEDTEILYRYSGRLTGSSVNMRTGPATTYAILTKLTEQQKVTVIGQSWNADGIIWYHVIVDIGGQQLIGYVSSTYIALDTSANGVWATNNTEGLALKRSPSGNSSAVIVAEAEVTLTQNQYVYITGEQMVSGVKWMKVIVSVGDTTAIGYIPATNLTFAPESLEAPYNPVLSDADFEAAMLAEGFPESYLPYLLELHKQYPNWNFTAFQTGLDWETVIAEEDKVGYNLISNSKAIRWLSFASGAYNWGTDSFIPYDGSTWVTVSNAGLRYYMDPRNWLTESYIFMFEELSYDSENQTLEGVESILKGTPMYKTSFSYTDDEGNERTILYSQAFMEAAEYSGVSPYHLASRVKQEVVTSSTTFSSSATGKVAGFEGYYNFYNIGAYNSTASMGAIKNGLKFAKYGGTNATLNKGSLIPWNNRYDALVGGGYYIGSSYINRGQNTIYLQKFNVSGRSTYGHQYMANVEAPKSEAYKVYLAYQSMDDYDDMKITFSIPVYDNMPEKATEEPALVYNPNAYLKSLSLTTDTGERVTLDETFGYSTLEYSATVPAGVGSVNVSAKTVSSLAKVISGGEGMSLSEGENVLNITIQAQNGTTITYTVKVAKEAAETVVEEAVEAVTDEPQQ